MRKKGIVGILCTLLLIFVIYSCGKTLNTEPDDTGLKILSPEKGDEWKVGSEYLIMWENKTGMPVTIDMSGISGDVISVGTFSHIMTEYLYTVPEISGLGEYRLELYVAGEPERSVKSALFAVSERENELPNLTITSPRDGKYISIGDAVHISVEATDDDGEVVSVRYYVNDIFKREVFEEPFDFIWNTSSSDIGIYTIKARAVDDRGGVSDDSVVNVVLTDGLNEINLIRIPTGKFIMGSNTGDHDEKPLRTIYITNDFYMTRYTITNEEYAGILNYALEENELDGNYSDNRTVLNRNGTPRELVKLDGYTCGIYFNGSQFAAKEGYEQKPATWVSWWGAAFYANMMSRKTGLIELYDLNDWTCDVFKTGFRLPTEAEHEIFIQSLEFRMG